MSETSDGQINSSPDFAVIDEAIREAMPDEVLSHIREGVGPNISRRSCHLDHAQGNLESLLAFITRP